MKICPRCQKRYPDDNLNYCLEDGSVLTAAPPTAPPETVMVNQTNMAPPPASQPAYGAPQQYTMQPPQRKSRAWLWVLIIIGGVMLLCGGGFAGLIYLGSQVEKNANLSTSSNTNSTTPTNLKSKSNSSSERTDVEKIDLEPWPPKFSLYGDTSYTNGELVLASKQKRFYYVLAGTADQTTENADTRVTVRNVDDAPSALGYGLVFHSDPKPLQQGYAFLIDSKKQKYRIVHHVPGDEKTVTGWTKSDAIRSGSADNTLEVRDLPGKIELYINGTMVKSIKNEFGYSGGVVGLYSGDAVKAGFKDMEIRR